MSTEVVRVAEARPPGGNLPVSPEGGGRLRLVEALRRLGDGMEDDLAAGAGAPLLVAVFATGIALYFSLPREPFGPAVVALALLVAVATFVARRRGARALVGMFFSALLAGAAVGVVATWRADAPRLDRERTVTVTGRVIDLDATAKGGVRLGVEVARMEAPGLPADAVPERITATLAPGRPVPAMGAAVTFKARLKPPQGPVLPGGYDFARRAWFEGRGASGYVLGKVQPADLGPPSPIDRLVAPIGTLRHAIAERVRASLPGATGTIAAALMVGEQRAIPEAAAEPLRASGLTHIVSISGLHMSLVAGGVMVVLRLFFIAVPGFPARGNAKKGAAIAAFLAATVYLLLSGMQVAALRSHLMVSLALLAVLVDRPAITMHTVAVAALAILAIDPEQAMEPSFRMSFLAVIALVASWDLWQIRVAKRPPPTEDGGPIADALVGLWRHAEGLAFSSLVAGLATAPVIAGVFHRGAPYSILANMAVLPIVGLLVMPAAVVAALALPFGLEDLPLWAMGLGIDYMVAVGRWVSGLPGGAGAIGRPQDLAMPFGIVAVLWLSLWRSRVRLFGLVPAGLAIVLVVFGPRADVLIGRQGSAIAVRGDDGRLHVLADRNDRFDVAIWLGADGDARAPSDPTLKAGWRCDAVGCAFSRSGGASGASPLEVAVVRDPHGFAEDCRRADVVVTTLAAPPGCGTLAAVFDRPSRAKTGAVAVTAANVGDATSVGTHTAHAPADRAAPSESLGDVAIDPTRDDDVGPSEAEDPPRPPPPAARTGGAPQTDEATGTPEPSRSRPRPILHVEAAQPNAGRPWTPRDPFAARMAREAAADPTPLEAIEPVTGPPDGISDAEDR